MKALTLHQPWASLVAVGAKTIETRSWGTDYRGPLAIHAGKSNSAMNYLGWLEEHQGEAEPALEPFADRVQMVDRSGRGILTAIHDLPLGAVVASATLVDVVPVVDRVPDQRTEHFDHVLHGGDRLVHATAIMAKAERHVHQPDVPCWELRTITAELPFGDFSPGRFAWLLADVAPTTERCPWCWGLCRVENPAINPARHSVTDEPCPVCSGAGKCEPIPTRGKQGLWDWSGVTSPGETR